MESKFCGGTDYLDKFDGAAYLRQYAFIENSQHMLRCYHSAFQDLPSGLSVLDYGSGPSVRGVISAATKASEIVLSDYSPTCLQLARDWVDNKEGSFNWDPHFNYVVKDLEGGGDDKVAERKEQVRKAVKGFARCDITQEPPIEEKYHKSYDVVISSLVLEAMAKTDNDYFDLVSRMTKLVKPGGYFLLYGIENSANYYEVGNHTFYAFPITTTLTKSVLERCHFSLLDVDKFTTVYENFATYVFTKSQLSS